MLIDIRYKGYVTKCHVAGAGWIAVLYALGRPQPHLPALDTASISYTAFDWDGGISVAWHLISGPVLIGHGAASD